LTGELAVKAQVFMTAAPMRLADTGSMQGESCHPGQQRDARRCLHGRDATQGKSLAPGVGTDGNVPKELEATVPEFEVPFIPIIEKGRDFPSMTIDLTKYPWFRWPPVEFDNKEKLLQMLKKAVINPANEMGKERDERRTMLFPEKSK
jgi:hypothetical protein